MRGNAEGFNHDLRAASLANLHVQLGRLADDNIIRLHISADFPCGHALEALLMDNARHVDIAREAVIRILRIVQRCRQHGGQGALHIGGSAPVHPAVHNLGAKWVMLPFCLIRYGYRIHMAVKEKLWPWFGALYVADAVAVSVHVDICKFVLVTEFLHDVHYQVLLSAVAGSLNHLGCEGQEFLRPFLV